MSRGRSSTSILLAVVALGCSSTLAPATDTDAGFSPDPPGSYTVTFGPVTVPPGIERTQCVVKRLGNASPMHVGSVHNVLGDSSHHLIVYRVADTTEVITPFKCAPFTDTLDPAKGSTLMITQKKDEVLTLPKGVAYTLDANQMIRLEMHYINTTRTDKTLSASSTMVPIANGEFRDEANFLFIGDPDIDLPAGKRTTLGPIFFQVPAEFADAKFFAMTGHEHHLGTNVKVSVAADATDPGTPVYDVADWSWSEPKTVFTDPAFTVPANGGFRFSCAWDNPGPATVKFGESANAEMCFFWAYYYPSKGSRVCFHTTKTGSAVDFCCPGSALCKYVAK